MTLLGVKEGCRVKRSWDLPGTPVIGHVCQTRLPDTTAGHDCRTRLRPAIAPGKFQDYFTPRKQVGTMPVMLCARV